ncbi:hypothetical protein ARZXY2_1279 [Arthrobacter sp. ZXY-2]|nr:hypothetical protein ARZXY2_1279 [Arthrobacter sp. ZXY-2]
MGAQTKAVAGGSGHEAGQACRTVYPPAPGGLSLSRFAFAANL